ncbi:MAG: GGDEF domain-containing response regulator, partial [Desulfobacterales bacterium]
DQGKINFSRATTLAEAVEILKEGQFDLIFLDYYLPDGNGLEFLKRTMKNGLKTPIVVITGKGDEMTAAQVIKVGAYDYLAKDRVSNKSLSRIITNTLDKAQLHREVEQAQKKLAELSTRDELTGLYNRRFFDEALEREIARARRYGSDLVLCMLDLDHFKKVNDTYGHAAGDSVLSEVSKMLKNCIRKSDFVGRYGGEEFAILLPNTGPEQARIVSEKFRRMVAGHHFGHNGSRFQLTVSLGIAAYNRISDPSSDQLVEFADQALYRAKREGRNRVFFFPMGQIETPAHV